MRERLAALGGELTLRNLPAKGAALQARLPLGPALKGDWEKIPSPAAP
jgi:hypothetical protein